LLQAQDPVLADRIKFTIGLICGGMKSKHYSEAIAWEQGIAPSELVRIDFRKKFPDKPAHFKGNEVESRTGETRLRSSKDLFVTDYGMGFFKPNACDYCDDVVGELADLSIGDAWLPHLVFDPKGNSLVITRNAELDGLITDGVERGDLRMKPLPEAQAIASQSAGFRHRREGLAYRLQKRAEAGEWTPPKRVQPAPIADSKRRAIYDLREVISRESHIEYLKAREAGTYSEFVLAMQPFVNAYKKAYGRGTAVRVFSKLSLVVVAVRSRIARILRPS
jgi:coenzyme F420-reducing hydrogenase beta subunit